MSLELANPQALFLLWLLPLMLGIYWLGGRLRARSFERFLGVHMPPAASLSSNFRAFPYLRAVLGTAAAALLSLSLARPVWGYRVMRQERLAVSLAIAIDTSRSMLATDCPGRRSRLDFANLKAAMLLEALKGDRVGLVAFAGEGVVACPLTFDLAAPKAFLEALESGSVPLGGTSLDTAITAGLKMLQNAPAGQKALIVVSDGEDTSGASHAPERALKAARSAKEAGVKVITLGVGSLEGAPIRTKGPGGSWEYVKDAAGNVVQSRLNEPFLKELAAATEGLYARGGSGNEDIDAIAAAVGRLERSGSEESLERIPIERYRWPALAAFACIITLIMLPKGARVG